MINGFWICCRQSFPYQVRETLTVIRSRSQMGKCLAIFEHRSLRGARFIPAWFTSFAAHSPEFAQFTTCGFIIASNT